MAPSGLGCRCVCCGRGGGSALAGAEVGEGSGWVCGAVLGFGVIDVVVGGVKVGEGGVGGDHFAGVFAPWLGWSKVGDGGGRGWLTV